MKIGVVGCLGRVGSLLVQEILSGAWKGAELAGGTVLPGEERDTGYFITSDSAALFTRADVVIDFTCPTATLHHATLAAKHGKALIVGTTGLSAEDEAQLRKAAEKTVVMYAANMSVGVNILLALVEQAAERLGEEWDIEIFEAHHKHKIDAPSGTALAIGKSAAKGRGVALDDVAAWARHGQTGAREKGAIGFSVARGGDVVGEHMATFYADGERLQLGHVATNRSLFARGALRAALWTDGQKPGLYSMKDVLGL